MIRHKHERLDVFANKAGIILLVSGKMLTLDTYRGEATAASLIILVMLALHLHL